jgi:hypothetical protein
MKKSRNSLAIGEGHDTIWGVPLTDDFGDWATPKKPTAGHFFLRCVPTSTDHLGGRVVSSLALPFLRHLVRSIPLPKVGTSFALSALDLQGSEHLIAAQSSELLKRESKQDGS